MLEKCKSLIFNLKVTHRILRCIKSLYFSWSKQNYPLPLHSQISRLPKNRKMEWDVSNTGLICRYSFTLVPDSVFLVSIVPAGRWD